LFFLRKRKRRPKKKKKKKKTLGAEFGETSLVLIQFRVARHGVQLASQFHQIHVLLTQNFQGASQLLTGTVHLPLEVILIGWSFLFFT
jgi:hypothetical protein